MSELKSIKVLQENLIQVISKNELVHIKGGSGTNPFSEGLGFTIEDEIIM